MQPDLGRRPRLSWSPPHTGALLPLPGRCAVTQNLWLASDLSGTAVRQLAAVSYLQRRSLLGVNRNPKTSDAMISQDREIEVRDVWVRHKDQPIVAGGKPRPRLDRAEVQNIEALPGQSHNLEPYARVVVVMAELSNSCSEGAAEERHVEHPTAIGRSARRVKRLRRDPR